MMAAAAAGMHPRRVESLSLLSPAVGYGASPPAVREERRASRLAIINQFGPKGMAKARSGNVLSHNATLEQRALVMMLMGRVHVRGYSQATELLSSSDLDAELATWCASPAQLARTALLCGRADTITTHEKCAAFAARLGIICDTIASAGHAIQIEASAEVNAWLAQRLQ